MKLIPDALAATVGLALEHIDTPALVIDLDAMDRNITRMADFARKHNVRWRPHAKMHKSAELAVLMEGAGAQGVCVQKVAEAEALSAGGVRDITITNEVIALPKLQRVARLAAQLAARDGRLTLVVDSAEGIARLAEAMAEVVRAAHQTRLLIEAAGVPVPLITGSGTGTLVHEAASGVYGELQAGSFLFMDADYARNEREPAQPVFEHALFVKTQVMSVCASHAVCDAGHKSHAIDSGLPTVALLAPEQALRYANGGDEHGILHATNPDGQLPALGQMLWLIPGHCDPTVNLHDFLIGVRGGLATGVVERIIRVDARGALT